MTQESAVVTLDSSEFYGILVQYIEETGEASVVMEWETGGGTKEVVPETAFYYPVKYKQLYDDVLGGTIVTVQATELPP